MYLYQYIYFRVQGVPGYISVQQARELVLQPSPANNQYSRHAKHFLYSRLCVRYFFCLLFDQTRHLLYRILKLDNLGLEMTFCSYFHLCNLRRFYFELVNLPPKRRKVPGTYESTGPFGT